MSTANEINRHIDRIIRDYRTIAVVGLSEKSWRPSHGVAKLMVSEGYEVVPVNPNCSEVLGIQSRTSLLEVSGDIDLVDVFRRPEFVDDLVDEALQIGAKAIWMQLGVINHAAAQKALEGGMEVVMDRCWAIEHRRVFGKS